MLVWCSARISGRTRGAYRQTVVPPNHHLEPSTLHSNVHLNSLHRHFKVYLPLCEQCRYGQRLRYPRSRKSTSVTNTKKDDRQGTAAYDLEQRILVYPESVENFLDTFVPSAEPYSLTDNLSGAFSQYKPAKGKEVQGYSGLVRHR